MKKFIVTAEPQEQFNYKNESLGMSDKLAVFYSPSIGKHRIYRNSLDNPAKGLKLLEFKSKEEAQKVCDLTNEISTNKYKVEEVIVNNK